MMLTAKMLKRTSVRRRSFRSRRTWTVLTAALAALLAWPLGRAAAQTEVNRSVTADPQGEVKIENFAGSVVVRGWDKNEVAVTGTLGRDVEELEVRSKGREVRIKVEFEERRGGRNVASHLEIQVPSASLVDVETVSAEITVDGVSGALEVETVSGNLTVEGALESVDVETVSGQVDVLASTEYLKLEGVSGDLQLVGASGEVDVELVSGDVEIRAESLRQLEAKVVSGDLDIYGAPAPGSEIEVSSHSGDVTLWLPSTTSAKFEVQTFSGDIENRLGPAARKTNRYTSERELKFTLGDGSADIELQSFSGTVAIRPREAGAI